MVKGASRVIWYRGKVGLFGKRGVEWRDSTSRVEGEKVGDFSSQGQSNEMLGGRYMVVVGVVVDSDLV